MFLDEALIEVRGGDGGRGCVSWRREKFIPKGGPDGGDGGRGGNVFLIANENTDTLSDFASRKKFEAPKGIYGSGNNRHGKDGEDLYLKVPPGCTIEDVSDPAKPILLADLAHHGDQFVAARGGRGGFGNAHFVSSVRQRPDFAELGEPGHVRQLKLELKLVADVGIIGYPSVGKSTLISVISAAKPKIAAYPFTTLVPNLGVVLVGDRSYVVSDLPGLIEGASEGKGLGDAFLKHIERSGVLLHVLDLSRALVDGGGVDVDLLEKDYRVIRKELEAYSPTLTAKPELVILNKSDLLGNDTAQLEKELKKRGIPIFLSISAATKHNTQELTQKLLPIVMDARTTRQEAKQENEDKQREALPVLRPHLESDKMGAFRVEKLTDGSYRVKGKRIEQFASMTDFVSPGGKMRFRDVVGRTGLLNALKRAGWKDDETAVTIGDIRVEHYL